MFVSGENMLCRLLEIYSVVLEVIQGKLFRMNTKVMSIILEDDEWPADVIQNNEQICYFPYN